MLPADLDDEQRADLAHEHPIDLDSTPSSPSSGAPTYYDPHSHRRPKSASHHRLHTVTDGSSSSHLLARLVSTEEEVREINAALVVATERLEAESSRANAAERRALDYFHRLRIATENRERAEQEAARLREELKLYKLQLENAQKEIFRAQDIIDQVSAQRNEAEAEAARARSKARKLQEEKLVMLAHEEGHRVGYQEGLSRGRRMGYDEGREHDADDEDALEPTTDEERNDSRPRVQPRSSGSIRQQPTRSGSAPPVRTLETASLTPPLPIRVHTPSHENRALSPPRESDEPETIRPIPIRPSPILSTQPISVPVDDGWIPRADSRTSYIAIPSPHKLQPPLPVSPNSAAVELQDRRATPQPEPTPVPPPIRSRDYAYQTSAPPHAHVPRGHTPSLPSRASSHLSQYELVNKRPGSSLRNEIYVGRARSGSRPSRGSISRNEHRDPERRHSARTEAETIAEQWREDSDADSPPRNPPRSFTPAPVPHPYRPPNFYYRPREAATPAPLDVEVPRANAPVLAEATVSRPQPQPDDPASNPAHTRSPLDYLRKRFRQRPGSGGSGSIPNIIVESPSEPETAMSPSAATAAQPELLSPEAANRPLPRDDAQHQHQHQRPSHSHSQSYSQSQSQPQSHRHYHQSSAYDNAPPRSGSPYTPWPAGFVPYPPGYGTTSSSSGPEKDRDTRRTYARPAPSSSSAPYANPNRLYAGSDSGLSQNGHVRTRTQSASTPMGRVGGGAYDAAPLPPGMAYPAPPARPHTSHRQHRDRNREWEWDRDGDRDRERTRDVRDWDWERDRDRVRDRDRDGRRRDVVRDYEQDRGRGWEEQDEDMRLEGELAHSPAPLQRPISLFDSDE